MTKIAHGMSQKWYAAHCCICKKVFSPKENRVRGTATFLNDEVVKVLYCEPCAVSAEFQEASKQTKEMGKKDA